MVTFDPLFYNVTEGTREVMLRVVKRGESIVSVNVTFSTMDNSALGVIRELLDEGGREGGREGGKEKGREGRREGGREESFLVVTRVNLDSFLVSLSSPILLSLSLLSLPSHLPPFLSPSSSNSSSFVHSAVRLCPLDPDSSLCSNRNRAHHSH